MNNLITSKTKLISLLGHPVMHSLSPQIHNTAFQCLNLNYVYLVFDIIQEDLEVVVTGMKAIGARGFNVTMPYKKDIIPYLNEISNEARLIGTVNTVVNQGGHLIGYNTDGKGYIQSLAEEGVSIINKCIVIIGAGGAASSIAIQTALEGANEIIILNRTLEKAENIIDIIRKNIFSCKAEAEELNDKNLKKAMGKSDILINCTSIGMYPNEDKSIIGDESIMPPDLVVSDLIYKPYKTKLLKLAEKRGCKCINGLGMLLWQGAFAFKLWTGKEMPVDFIKDLLKKSF